jgi:pimeloyl-ACP methyl ester carboxylesterase
MNDPKHPEPTTAGLCQFHALGEGADQRQIAYRTRPASRSGQMGIVWLGGFKSDMHSTKALAIDAFAAARGMAYLRFDYSGHGESSGRFEDGTIGHWAAESLALLRSQTQGPQIIVGSSMGGWIALLLARALFAQNDAHRLGGLVLIAPAIDFTQALMWDRFPTSVQAEIERTGQWMRPSPYAPEPYPITRRLIEEGRQHLLLGSALRSHCPVHILQGMQDPDVPWQHAMTLVEHLAADPVVLTLIRDGDHRLSRDEDIKRLMLAIESLITQP